MMHCFRFQLTLAFATLSMDDHSTSSYDRLPGSPPSSEILVKIIMHMQIDLAVGADKLKLNILADKDKR